MGRLRYVTAVVCCGRKRAGFLKRLAYSASSTSMPLKRMERVPMAAGLTFSLVSPERELFAGEADAVLVPGTEGLFEVGPGHSPVMATLSPGMLVIKQATGEERYFVRGGFADVTAAGLTVLAEVAIPADELHGDRLAAEKSHAEGILAANDVTPEEVLAAGRAAEALASV